MTFVFLFYNEEMLIKFGLLYNFVYDINNSSFFLSFCPISITQRSCFFSLIKCNVGDWHEWIYN